MADCAKLSSPVLLILMDVVAMKQENGKQSPKQKALGGVDLRPRVCGAAPPPLLRLSPTQAQLLHPSKDPSKGPAHLNQRKAYNKS